MVLLLVFSSSMLCGLLYELIALPAFLFKGYKTKISITFVFFSVQNSTVLHKHSENGTLICTQH